MCTAFLTWSHLASREHYRTCSHMLKWGDKNLLRAITSTLHQPQRTKIHIFVEKSPGLWVMKPYFLGLIRHGKYWDKNGFFYYLWVVLSMECRFSRSITPVGKCCTAYGRTAPQGFSWPWAHRGLTALHCWCCWCCLAPLDRNPLKWRKCP